MMNHKEKIKLARKMRTHEESVSKDSEGNPKLVVSIFNTKAWKARTKAIQERIANKILKIKKAKNGK